MSQASPLIAEEVRVDGLDERVRIVRDRWGIPHVTAQTEADAWFGLGYACAHDRLWQMESDRRRAVGRWAEVVGEAALSADRLARRLQLRPSSQADVDAMSRETRGAFDAYAAGVNARIGEGRLPPEFALTGARPEPWEPWHSVAVSRSNTSFLGRCQRRAPRGRLPRWPGVRRS